MEFETLVDLVYGADENSGANQDQVAVQGIMRSLGNNEGIWIFFKYSLCLT